MGFGRYLFRRILQMIPVMIFVVIFNFLIINFAPGDPVVVLAGENATQEYMDELRESFGLNEPLHTRFIIYFSNLIQGDLGVSYTYNAPVSEVILEKLKVTLMLVVLSETITIIVGTTLGAIAARYRGKLLDSSISNMAMILYCLPAFWLGMILILTFAVHLQVLPSSGMYSFGSHYTGLVDLLRHLILPATTLFLVQLPIYIKVTRSSVIEVAQEDFIKTARAIGYSESVVYRKFALRNALLPTVTIAGLSLSTLFTGSLLTETVFSWPGMGRMIFDAISARDYPLIMGGFIVTTFLVIIGTLITDLIYTYLDPRVVNS
ncbi:ABC transporter permease [Oceanobacillus sojae]|uniref:ABC transporter permease n=1 Tax=Oceanobacillus sojae TaxID=582851 RepID=UPI0021A57930|nr:ABC transporter permease [Oceanobacillus sojae]MCT1901914.1 ABC transporter permease [Oceanobacillus sojae]